MSTRSDFNVAFGRHLKEILDKRKLTPGSLSVALTKRGVTIGRKGVEKWLRGDSTPPMHVLFHTAAVLGLRDWRKILPV